MRPTKAREQIGVALFPFLAVLICTMGALIVLLVLLVQQASVNATTLAQQRKSAAAQPDSAKLREQLEDATWRREMLEKSRTAKSKELADKRAELAHLEDHIHRLEARAKELFEQARQQDESQPQRHEDLAAKRAELLRLQEELTRKKAELAQKKASDKNAERWYALIPYDGPNGTRRRPIYIECTLEGIIIQPEGLMLMPDDFVGPLGPGNPLDAALRTIREGLARSGGKGGEPYPLLIVRPSGILAYGKARAALAAWDDEFGYELISEDLKLDFGERDAALAAELERAVALARQRQTALAAAMPRRFGSGAPAVSFSGESWEQGAGAGNGSAGRGGAAAGAGGSVAGLGAGSGSRQGAAGGGFGGGRYGGGGASANENLANGTAGGEAAPGATELAPGGSSGSSSVNAQRTQVAYGNASQGTGGSPGGSSFRSSGGNGPAGGAASGSAAGASSGSAAPSVGSQAAKFGDAKSQTANAGRGRGSNWGLPNANGRVTAITRPIHVAVLRDRLVILPDPGDDRPMAQVPLSPQLAPQDVDAFVGAVQREMKAWGLAVENGYWKPQILMEVAPGAESRLAELETALEGSGFDLQRKLR